MRLVRLPDVQQSFATQAFETVGLGPSEFPKFIRSETRKYEHVVKLAKIKVE
jgi:tripartite-type tricarboxylate transporter receptor subunit TctC